MVQWNSTYKGLVFWDVMLHQRVRGSTHFKWMCCNCFQVFEVHKKMISSWTLLQNISNHSHSNAVSHPVITPLQKTQNVDGTYLPSDIGHIIVGHPLISFIGIWTNPALWVSYWHISLWLNSVTYLQEDDTTWRESMSTQHATFNRESVSWNENNKTINLENHSPQINKEYTMMAASQVNSTVQFMCIKLAYVGIATFQTYANEMYYTYKSVLLA